MYSTPYLFMGLAVIFGITALFIISLLVRYSNTKRDLARLNQMLQEENQR